MFQRNQRLSSSERISLWQRRLLRLSFQIAMVDYRIGIFLEFDTNEIGPKEALGGANRHSNISNEGTCTMKLKR